MLPSENPGNSRQSSQFLFLYALAWAGGAIAYVPFLTILLPIRISDLAGEQSVDWLAYIAFAGAIAASLGNIGFGWLSDLSGTRRPWIAVGLAVSCLLLVSIPAASNLATAIALVVIWQLGLNMMLGPLGAWAGDCVPDHQKGLLGGLMSGGPLMGALVGALVTLPELAGPDQRLWLVAAFVAVAVLPILLFGDPKPFPELMGARPSSSQPGRNRSLPAGAVERMWLARLMVQIAEASLFAFLYLWLRSIEPDLSDNRVALLFTIVLAVSIPVTLLTGRCADRRERPIIPLVVASFGVALGLLIMGLSTNFAMVLAGYVVFGITGTAFLALHSAQTLRVLPKPKFRGRDLGIFNLTNTVPSLIMPWLAIGLVPMFGFTGLFLLLAGFAVVAGLLLLSITHPL